MTTSLKSTFLQIFIGVTVGIFVGILSGSGTAYYMVTQLERKLEVHIAQNVSTEAQLRRDIERLEKVDLGRDIQMKEYHKDVAQIKMDIAVIAERIKRT